MPPAADTPAPADPPRLPAGPRGAWLILAFCVALAVPAWLTVRHLELRTDFSDLLPEGMPSVIGLHELERRVGGTSTLYVAIEGDAAPAGAFADQIAAAFRQRLGNDVIWVDDTVRPVRAFYEHNALLYMPLADLRLIDDALDRVHRRLNPFYAGLDDEKADDDELAARVRALRERRKSAHFKGDHYTSEDGRLTVVTLRPAANATGVAGARRFVDRFQALVTDLHPERRGLKVTLAGSTKASVEEYDTLRRDIFGTAALCVALVMGVVWLFLRRVRVVLLLGIPLAFGALYAFALARLAVGYVNAQTAFLGALIVGTGINYGVMQSARYLEEVGRGRDGATALAIALRATFRPTLAAATATAVSFAALGFAQIRSFSQFGFIGSTGIMICWILSFTMFPALLLLVDRLVPLRPPTQATAWWRRPIVYPRWAVALAVGAPRLVLGVTAVAAVASVVFFLHFLPNALEYDLRNLRNKSSETSPTAKLGGRIAHLFRASLTPAVVATRDREQARRVCDVLNAMVQRVGADKAPIKECISIWSLLPKEQEQHLELIDEIRNKAARLPEAKLDAEARDALKELRAHLDVKRLGLDDLPDVLTRRFLERDGTRGALVMVNPPAGRTLWVRHNLFAFADTLRDIDLGRGEHVLSSGEAVVFADIQRAIERDAPRTTWIAALMVFGAIVLTLRRVRPVAEVSVVLFTGVLLLVGIAAALRIKYNFFNYVALPTTFGIGLDYAINVQQRAALEGTGRDAVSRALLGTGAAVFLASSTTILGYGVLLMADNRALVSFGALAILGEVTTLVCALVVLPALLSVGRR